MCITKMVISVSMVTYNKIRGRNNSLSVRTRAYSSIMVNPLVIKGDTRNTIVYNISVINCSCKRSIYCLEIDSKLLRERLMTLCRYRIKSNDNMKNSHDDWEYKTLVLKSLAIPESILGLKLSVCCDESTI
jgi:hypothetical protein